MHFWHLWLHLSDQNIYRCLACNAEITDYQFQEYPFLSWYYSEDYPYWYDFVCDEIWNRLKTTGYLKQRIITSNPESVEPWNWKVGYEEDKGR
jgi:hypothetical protein